MGTELRLKVLGREIHTQIEDWPLTSIVFYSPWRKEEIMFTTFPSTMVTNLSASKKKSCKGSCCHLVWANSLQWMKARKPPAKWKTWLKESLSDKISQEPFLSNSDTFAICAFADECGRWLKQSHICYTLSGIHEHCSSQLLPCLASLFQKEKVRVWFDPAGIR